MHQETDHTFPHLVKNLIICLFINLFTYFYLQIHPPEKYKFRCIPKEKKKKEKKKKGKKKKQCHLHQPHQKESINKSGNNYYHYYNNNSMIRISTFITNSIYNCNTLFNTTLPLIYTKSPNVCPVKTTI